MNTYKSFIPDTKIERLPIEERLGRAPLKSNTEKYVRIAIVFSIIATGISLFTLGAIIFTLCH